MQNFKKHFWRIFEISYPLTLATASGTIFILIDCYFATKLSIETYEAVFLTLPIMGLCTGIGVGLAGAIADLISKEKILDNIKRLITAGVFLCLISTLIFLYITLFHNDWIEQVAGLHHLENDSLITTEFRAYWKVILWTFPVQILFSLTIQLLTILEKQKIGLFIIFSNLTLNILLDYLFTQVLFWGVEGLAYSTLGVFTIGGLFSWIALSKEEYCRFPYPTIFDKLFLKALQKISFLTFLIFISIGIFSISAIIINQIALGISTSALVVLAVYSQIMQIFIIATRGFSGGFLIYFGNAFRDKKASDYFPIYWSSTAWISVFNLTGGILILLIPNKLINLYENIDPNLYSDIRYFLKVGAIIMIIYVLPRLAMVGFISLNKAYLLVLHSFLFVTIQILCAYFWTKSYGTNGLVYAELVAAIASNILFLPLFYHLLLKMKKSDQLEIGLNL